MAKEEVILVNKDNRKIGVEEKIKAHKIVEKAIKSGELIPEPCEVCGKKKAHAHHSDYSRPLDVEWLCHLHHKQAHSENK